MLRAYNQLFGNGVMEAWVAQQGPEKLSAELKDIIQRKACDQNLVLQLRPQAQLCYESADLAPSVAVPH
jgi:hypothetical protein